MNLDERKTYDNTSSSYLSLKAELLHKQQDVQRASSSSTSSSAILDKLQSTSSSLKIKATSDLDVEIVNPSKKKRKSDKVASPPSTAAVAREDEIAYAKSRAILEAKSKLYDQIMSNSDMKLLAEDDGNEDDDKSFLVDFERKIYETNQHSNKIEYTDSFGRTRLVTPEEYKELKKDDNNNSYETNQAHRSENEIERVERLHREQMRSKWEADMEAIRNKTQLHYQDVLFDEKREHGVGFYTFSTDDKQRAEQMETLNELRTNTKIEQSKFLVEKEKRQMNMTDRLNKIRLRKAKELGINLSENSELTRESTKDMQIESNVKELLTSSINNTKEIMEPVSVNKSFEKDSDCVEISQSIQEKSSQQTLKLIPTQQQASTSTTNQMPKKSNSSFAYPFPVIRTGTSSSSMPDTHN